MSDLDQKELMKQALKEWMDEQYAKFGKFILGKIAFAALVTFLVWYISVRGYKFP